MLKKFKSMLKVEKICTGQLELILKNKIIIPKDFKSDFIRDNFIKPIVNLKVMFLNSRKRKLKQK